MLVGKISSEECGAAPLSGISQKIYIYISNFRSSFSFTPGKIYNLFLLALKITKKYIYKIIF